MSDCTCPVCRPHPNYFLAPILVTLVGLALGAGFRFSYVEGWRSGYHEARERISDKLRSGDYYFWQDAPNGVVPLIPYPPGTGPNVKEDTMHDRITQFRGQYDFLDNTYPCLVMLEGDLYPSAEHAFQAAKTQCKEARLRIRDCMDGLTARRAGAHLRDGNERAWYDGTRDEIMEAVLADKFSRNKFLRSRLIATGEAELIFSSDQDKYWGMVRGRGENKLGIALMALRARLAAGNA